MLLLRIFYVAIVGASAVGGYLYGKKKFDLKIKRKVHYKFDIFEKYDAIGKKRQYSYNILEPTFEKMEEQYKESLYGNPIMKGEIDDIVKDYINTYPQIIQKTIVLNRPEWSAKFTNTNGTKNDVLVIDIINDTSASVRSILFES